VVPGTKLFHDIRWFDVGKSNSSRPAIEFGLEPTGPQRGLPIGRDAEPQTQAIEVRTFVIDNPNVPSDEQQSLIGGVRFRE
jgi:hypothetical protein